MQTITHRPDRNAGPAESTVGAATRRGKLRVGLAVVGALAAISIGIVAVTAGSSSGNRTVQANLREWAVSLNHTTLSPGKYTFKIADTGKAEHELIAFRTSLAPSALAIGSDGRINEDDPALVSATDGPDLKAGQTVSRTVDLTKPGTYIFMCNLTAHYGLGMHTVVTVK
jgi:uncharacterized cupredoxin-like copper-binding protein